jgi:hypothetical protein
MDHEEWENKIKRSSQKDDEEAWIRRKGEIRKKKQNADELEIH